jgi:hypothetical protein
MIGGITHLLFAESATMQLFPQNDHLSLQTIEYRSRALKSLGTFSPKVTVNKDTFLCNKKALKT